MITTYLIDIVLLLIAAVVAVPFFQAIKSGAVPGFLIAGIIVGPYGFGLISNIREIGNLSEIGVVSETLEASLELAGIALSTLRFDENKQKVILSDFRRKYQLELEDALKDEKRKN
ncbi:MAG: cation:proton antiporter [Colwellia sp.]|nr:cation:proton antiporter [Colwellia sp.]